MRKALAHTPPRTGEEGTLVCERTDGSVLVLLLRRHQPGSLVVNMTGSAARLGGSPGPVFVFRIKQGCAWRAQIPVSSGQLAYEWEHLGKKLAKRSPEFPREDSPTPYPLFVVVSGGVADWEVTG